MSKINLTYFLYGAIDVTDLAWVSIGLVMKRLGFSPISSQGVVRSSRWSSPSGSGGDGLSRSTCKRASRAC